MQIIVSNTELMEGDYGEYLKVTYKDKNGKESFRNIGAHFKDRWSEFTQGRMIELKYRKGENDKWILQEIIPAQLSEQPSNAPQSKSEPLKEESNKLLQHAIKEGAVIDKPSGQEVGMTTKEIGDMIRADKLSVLFGAETAKKIAEWYMNRIKSTTGVN